MEDIITLGFLILLQAVLGFDNLLYISLESKRVAAERQAYVRRLGIALAVVLRVLLLFVLIQVVDATKNPFFALGFEGVVEASFNMHSVIVLVGGAFILYTAIKEIFHMLHIEHDGAGSDKGRVSVGKAVFWIVTMNLVFSFDSILSAMALTSVFWVMAAAIGISGLLMMALADRVSVFLQKNRMYEVLGLFILLIVGVMLLTEGGHLAHLKLFGNEVTPMTKTTFYFVISVLVVSDIAQSRYQKKLLKKEDEQNRRAVAG
ncbi:MAG: tellurium resistance protein TerC [Planctomycetota bacterium]|nr:tellurium resistance protein TerC [Planctomycetota bacterium]